MSFAGHVMDMISRMKQNEALKSSRRYKYKKIKDAYFEEIGSYHAINNLTKQNLSKEELLIVKKRIKARLKSERKRSLILTMVFVILVCTFLAYLIYDRLKLHM
jgi:hypothetical protein